MKTDSLDKIARVNLALGAAMTAVAGLLWGGGGMLAAGVGAALACVNFWAITRLGRRAVSRVEADATNGQAVALAVGLVVKMTVLFALVWIAVRVIKLQALPFALGISVFVFSILIVGLATGSKDQVSSTSSSGSSSSSKEAEA
jgi:hypothetical protein